MIGYLRGRIIERNLKNVLLDVGGVGYKIAVNSAELSKVPLDMKNEISFFTYLAVRENSLDLYGFETHDELDMFELLLTVSGVGPKSAMAILSVASVATLKTAISTEDSSHLTKVAGIGKKTADKIVLELKDKIGEYINDPSTSLRTSGHEDAVEALKSLGYSERESREALKKVSGETTEEKVRAALKQLNR